MKAQDKIIALVSDASRLPQLEKFIGLAKKIQYEVDNEIDLLSTCNEYHQNLITISILCNNLATTKILIVAGLDVNHGDMMGITPLLAAVIMNNIPAVDLLIASKADLNQTDLNVGSHSFELDEAASAEQLEAFIRYVNNKKRKRNTSDRSCVSFENYYGDEEEEISTSHNSPLTFSCFLAHQEIFYKLLAAGAAVTASVVEIAVCAHQNDMLKTLLERVNKDQINKVNSKGFTILEKAMLFDNLIALKMLFAYNAKAVSSWYFTTDRTYYRKPNRNDYGRQNYGVSNEVKELYLARTIENYLNACLSEEGAAGEDMVNFHFNYNTELFCNFVEFQLTTPEETSDKNIKGTQFVRLQAVTLTELFKKMLSLTIDEKANQHEGLMPVSVRQKCFVGLYLVIGRFLDNQGNPAAYLFFSKIEQDTAKKFVAEMLRIEIMRLSGEEAKALKPGLTCEMLKQQFPNKYAQAEANLAQKCQVFLVPEESEAVLPATEVEQDEKSSAASILHSTENATEAEVSDELRGGLKVSNLLKRHDSPIFGDIETDRLQSPSKTARSNSQEATSIEADANSQPPAPPVLKG